MPSPKTKRNITRIIPFGVIWLVFSIVYTLLERGILGHLQDYPSTGNPYNFSGTIIITPVAALIAGLLIGMIEILYFNAVLMQMSFGKKIFYKSVIYLLLILSFLVILTVTVNTIELKTGIFNKQVWDNVWAFMSNYSFLSVIIYMAAIIVVSLFYAEVSDSMGQEVLLNFFTGKYHKATEEERIFMFLDMKSSTTIAENLGHVKYFDMLKTYYADLSGPVIMYAGEIYQYVGDEMVVSWKFKKGLKNNNCIKCFFAMKAAMKKQSKKYREKFGLVPDFKAGFHFGKVTTGEIGALKKEIVFTGDTLNTTARIQGLCNSYNTDMLISGDLVKELKHNSQFQFISLGEHELRGRNEKIELFTIIQA
ncbi:MAG: adenylate/guanylate cyclase domain-containing protein [Ferruginibacter sp.]